MLFLNYVVSEAEKDLRTGFGVGYQHDPVPVELGISILDVGSYAIRARIGMDSHNILHPNDEYLTRVREDASKAEGYIAQIRDVAWKWAQNGGVEALPRP